MKRKLIYLFLVGLAFGVAPLTNVQAEETPTKEWCFAFDEDSGTITGYYFKNYGIYKYCNDDVVIPETIEGVEVKKIGNKAFMNDGISSVVIPETVTTIGNLAFASNYLSDVTIPDTVTKIGYAAFNNNPMEGTENEFLYARTNNGNGIAIIDDTKLIGISMETTFYYDDYYYAFIPDQVETIESKAFYGLQLDELYLPEGLTTIKDNAFYGSYIMYIDVPSTLQTADFSMDKEQIPFRDIVYLDWIKFDENYDYEPYTFKSGEATQIYSRIYERPEVYYLDANSVNYNKIKLLWDIAGDFDKVQIYRYNSSTGKYELNFTTTNYSAINMTKGLVTGKTYYYKVRGVVTTPDGKTYYSDFSNSVAVTPTLKAPTGVKATKYKSGVAKIKWNKVDGADGYTVFKYNSSKKQYYSVKSVKGTSTTTSFGIKKGYGYYYRVKAYKIVNGKKVYSKLSASSYVKV